METFVEQVISSSSMEERKLFGEVAGSRNAVFRK
jgi:hypothetical protein